MPTKRLIKYFSKKCVNPEIDENYLLGIFNKNDSDDLLAIKGYPEKYEEIEKNYKNLYDNINGLEEKSQVQNCLALLHDFRCCPKDIDILKELIRNEHDCIHNKWSEDGKKLYDTALEIVTEWKDYFLSHTIRNVPEVNNFTMEHIGCCFTEDEFKAKVDKRNLVADLIEKWLNHEGLLSFYDENNLVIGDEIGDEIENHCKSSFVFVQLVEKVMFTKPDGRPNWCHKEYEYYTKNKLIENDHKKYCFISTDGDSASILPVNVFYEYGEWVRKVNTLITITLAGKGYEVLKDDVQALAEVIYSAKHVILSKYLGHYVNRHDL